MARFYDIDTLLEEVVTLPSLPSTLADITQLIEDPACDIKELAQVISTDPAIALKCLRLVNSAYYGIGQRVTTVEHAVVLLGMKVIKNLVLTASVFEALDGVAEHSRKHAVACGMAMRVLGQMPQIRVTGETADEAFVFGLLHDIGKAIIEQYLPKEYAQIGALAVQAQIPWHLAEREILGIDHAALGARLAENWKLSPAVSGAIAGHHHLEYAGPYRVLAANLGLADYLSTVCGFPAHEMVVVTLSDETWQATQLARHDLPQIFERYMHAMPALQDLLALT